MGALVLFVFGVLLCITGHKGWGAMVLGVSVVVLLGEL